MSFLSSVQRVSGVPQWTVVELGASGGERVLSLMGSAKHEGAPPRLRPCEEGSSAASEPRNADAERRADPGVTAGRDQRFPNRENWRGVEGHAGERGEIPPLLKRDVIRQTAVEVLVSGRPGEPVAEQWRGRVRKRPAGVEPGRQFPRFVNVPGGMVRRATRELPSRSNLLSGDNDDAVNVGPGANNTPGPVSRSLEV